MNRRNELSQLDRWWNTTKARPGLVWGRRRVGKTALITHFARDKRMVFYTGVGGTAGLELRGLSEEAGFLSTTERDLAEHPFSDWRDALRFLFARAEESPLLLVLDEFPELLVSAPELPGLLRAELDRHGGRPQLKILLSGSSMRAMWQMQEYRAPLYGRFDLTMQLHPFRPHEVPEILTDLAPADRALVYGILGGIPLYLTMWQQDASIADNLSNLMLSRFRLGTAVAPARLLPLSSPTRESARRRRLDAVSRVSHPPYPSIREQVADAHPTGGHEATGRHLRAPRSFFKQVAWCCADDRTEGPMTMTENIEDGVGVQTDAGHSASRPRAPQSPPEDDQDAAAASMSCMHCGKASASMEPVPGEPGQFQCVSPTPYWNTTCSRFLPHCPPWCTEPHLPGRTPLDKVERWLHSSDRISTVFPDPEEDGLGPAMVEATIYAREPVGKELEPVEVHLGDIIMSPPQLVAFASVLETTALLASLDTRGRGRIECRQGCDYLEDPEPRPVLFMR